MPQVKQYMTYKYDELSEETKLKALERLNDINVDYDWYTYTYDDAENIGLKITSFEGHRYIKGELINSGYEVAKAIIANHGETCDTYTLAKQYLKDIEDKEEEEIEDITEEFEYSLLQEYLSLLQNEYDYLLSREAIEDTIRANDYDFTEEGRID